MSFLKQLLTPFVAFDEDGKEVKPKSGQMVSPPVGSTNPGLRPEENIQHPLVTAVPLVPAAQVPTYSPGGTITGPMPEHQQYFEQLVAKANASNPQFAGADYKEFVDSKVDIDDITDETLRYKTAFNVLRGSGLTRDKLLSTGQEYLNIIGRDLNAFQSAHGQRYKKEVQPKELQIQKKAEELSALALKMSVLKTEINALTQDITLIKDQLATTKNSFLLAGEKKQQEIQTELQKIAQYF
ncbi:MAG: hypothetical protein WKF70_13610 [Chitinophagaceae bacterium]